MRRGWVNEGSEGGSERALGREEGGKQKESEAKRAQKSPGGKGASSQR